MTKTAKWQICNLGKDIHIQELHYGALECGRESKIVSLKDIAEIYESASDEQDCIITCGSIWSNTALKEVRPNWIGNFHNKKMFCCSSYYPKWGKYLTQKNYCFLPLAEVIRRIDWVFDNFSVEGEIFIRPDSGEKDFPGNLKSKKALLGWYRSSPEALPSLMTVVSSPVDILKEIRLVIADNEIVAGSVYKMAKHIHTEGLQAVDSKVIEFVKKVLRDEPPELPPYFVLDLAEEPDGLSIMEVGCFCCCGLYDCDRRKVAEGVSRAAERFYHEKAQKR